jgi:hypothetical protein
MKRELFDSKKWRGVEWFDADGNRVLMSQTEVLTDKSLVSLGLPLVDMDLTESEAMALADQFALTVAVLLSDMRAELAKMRSGQEPVDPRTCPACLAKKARGGK